MTSTLMLPAGLVSLGAYIPAKKIATEEVSNFTHFLTNQTKLPRTYICNIKENGTLPGKIESNHDGWASKPWFETWLKRLPPKKQSDPFQGTKERRRVPLDPFSLKNAINPHPMLSSDAETLAGALALYNANIDPAAIDLILVQSMVQDRMIPSNASLVQDKLGLKNAGAYAVDTCCSSFVTMMELAMSLVRSNMKNNVLIIASNIDSHITDKSNYFSVFTGDAAVAGIVTRVNDGYGYISSSSTSHGNRHDAIISFHRSPEMHCDVSVGSNHAQEFATFFNQDLCKEIAKNAQQDLKKVADAALAKVNLNAKDLDFLVTHQPVAWAAHAWREAIGVPSDKFYESFEKYGNVASCCTGINLTEAVEKKLIKEGNKVMLASAGAGENHIALIHIIPPVLAINVARLAVIE